MTEMSFLQFSTNVYFPHLAFCEPNGLLEPFNNPISVDKRHEPVMTNCHLPNPLHCVQNYSFVMIYYLKY